MGFTASDVKELREKTGCGMMDCKKALTSSNGDMAATIDFLREKGLAAATKKSSRIAAEGLAMAYTNEEGTVGVAIEVNSETDFVAKNADFQSFVKLCGETVMEKNPSSVDELLKIVAQDGKTIESMLQEKILTIGENIKIRRFQRFDGVVAGYVHAGGKIGVLVKFDVENPEAAKTNEFKIFAKDIAMQIAAANPLYLIPSDVPSDVIDHERKILKEQIVNDGKPENIAEKIVEGRIGKYYKDVCLTKQVFVKDGNMDIDGYVATTAKNLGTEIKIISFVRFEKGEGIEKKKDDFATEVAGMIK
jgi:elongation factor Ts